MEDLDQILQAHEPPDYQKIENGNKKYIAAEKSHDKLNNEIEKIKIIVAIH